MHNTNQRLRLLFFKCRQPFTLTLSFAHLIHWLWLHIGLIIFLSSYYYLEFWMLGLPWIVVVMAFLRRFPWLAADVRPNFVICLFSFGFTKFCLIHFWNCALTLNVCFDYIFTKFSSPLLAIIDQHTIERCLLYTSRCV